MAIEIHNIGSSVVNRYLLRDNACILIDTGIPHTARTMTGAMARLGINPTEVALIVLTHGHVDHAGAVKAIQQLTGAKVAIHYRDQAWVEQGLVVVPPVQTAAGRMVWAALDRGARLLHFPPVKADIVIGDEGLSLAEFGMRGRVIHTPGHSMGSVSILLDTGEAFVGDLGASGAPFGDSPRLPPAAEDPQQVVTSWKRLLDLGAKTIYPGHGRPFPAEAIGRVLP